MRKKEILQKVALSPNFLRHAANVANKKAVKLLNNDKIWKKDWFGSELKLGKYNNQGNTFLREAIKREKLK